MDLSCPIQHYHWGKRGSSSIVARLLNSAHPDFIVDEDKPYAELWMGSHPNGPSYMRDTKESLEEHIEKDPSLLGEPSRQLFGDVLPFLFKVLSIKMPLSIQVHPNKKIAEELHATDPNTYKDPNHKPEIAITLSNFEALCGFRPIEEIKNYFKIIPEFSKVIGASHVEELLNSELANQPEKLKKCFTLLMTASAGTVKMELALLLNRLKEEDENTRKIKLAELLERVHDFFPGDVGCFCIYLFNYLDLPTNTAIYLAPDDPHAYISGDCIECMACSDNVIRAGLTPKFRDVERLCEIVSYDCAASNAKLLNPVIENDNSQLYESPVQEFSVARIKVVSSQKYTLVQRNSASICIIIRGHSIIEGVESVPGRVFFLKSNETVTVNVPANYDDCCLFQAFANV